jgi:hypothetical protein
MKIVRAASLMLLAAFIGMCAFLAYQSHPDRAQMEAGNFLHRVQWPWCSPKCGDSKTDGYIAQVNSEQPIKKVVVDEPSFQRAMSYANKGQVVVR